MRWFALLLLSSTLSTAVACGGDNSGGAATTSPATSSVVIATSEPLLQASDAGLLTVADLPPGWSMGDADPGSAIADPQWYNACGHSSALPLDVGFSKGVAGPFLGETIVASACTDAALRRRPLSPRSARYSASCSTGGSGRRAGNWRRRSSSGSRPGTTRDAVTRRSATSVPSTTNGCTRRSQMRHDQSRSKQSGKPGQGQKGQK